MGTGGRGQGTAMLADGWVLGAVVEQQQAGAAAARLRLGERVGERVGKDLN